jgi:head-tail adaptor
MLPADELAAMRATVEDALPDTAEVQRRTLTPDGAGGHTASWGTVATVACQVAPFDRYPREQVIGERLTATSLWMVTVPALTDVQPADRLVVGAGARVFEVMQVLARSFETARRVVCSEVL